MENFEEIKYLDTNSSDTGYIPDTINIEAFIEARKAEILALRKATENSNKVTTIFQRLPKHMRRRAMSHNVKRMPRNLRESHRRQLVKHGALREKKHHSKKYRHRPKNLMLEYNRRNKKYIWLETHIWHAKRFKMLKKWGYKIAEKSNNKTFRFSYRASKRHCLLQDISYFNCIQITATLCTIKDRFSLITSPECGLSITAKCWISGRRQGSIMIFHPNRYPRDFVANVDFMWRPEENDCSQLWISCHPSYYQELLNIFITIFQAKGDSCCYENQMDNIKISVVKLNRFRLTGPSSNSILIKAFHLAEKRKIDTKVVESVFPDVTKKLNQISMLWERKNINHEREKNIFKNLSNTRIPTNMPPRCIIGLHISDPRLFVKSKLTQFEECVSIAVLPSEWCLNSIWDDETRKLISINKISTAQLNKLRQELLLVPGNDELLLKKVNTVIPILLVQNPGLNNSMLGDFSWLIRFSQFQAIYELCSLGYGSGWDVIFPPGWARELWLALILSGARAGALRETSTINFESQNAFNFSPDSKAGVNYLQDVENTNKDKYFSMPPNHRTNYIKLGFSTPFSYPLDVLCENWLIGENNEKFWILRNRQALLSLAGVFSKINKNKCSFNFDDFIKEKCLVAVCIFCTEKGKSQAFSHICMPTKKDLLHLRNDRKYQGPIEQIHPDDNEVVRKELRKNHRITLKRLRRKRLKEKRTNFKYIKNNLEVINDYSNDMRKLWVQSNKNVRNSCDREIMGYVLRGGYSMIQAHSMGQGYVTIQSLQRLLDITNKGNEPLVLLRTPNSLNYKFAKLKIVLNQ